jgi:hypothetical protein
VVWGREGTLVVARGGSLNVSIVHSKKDRRIINV